MFEKNIDLKKFEGKWVGIHYILKENGAAESLYGVLTEVSSDHFTIQGFTCHHYNLKAIIINSIEERVEKVGLKK